MTVVVTGASGFVGSQLVKALRTHLPAERRLLAWDHASMDEGLAVENVEWRTVDLRNADAVTAAIRDSLPTLVFHLAARSSIQQSQGAAKATHDVNVHGTATLANALYAYAPGAVMIFASSGEVYGAAFASGSVLSETSPVYPLNPYARSKLAAEFILQDMLSETCPVIALRLLNHTGPGQDERFVVPSFAAQIARIERGLVPPRLLVGNLAAERDFLDVGDVIDAYLRTLELADSASGFQVYNVASGRPRSIASIVDRFVALSSASFPIEPDPNRMRPLEIASTHCDTSAFTRRTGWQPRRDFDATLADVLNWSRARVSQ